MKHVLLGSPFRDKENLPKKEHEFTGLMFKAMTKEVIHEKYD